jgi:acetylornithine deacetylase/succinyl-diaminopimelate desuccinylase-like protein
MTDHLRTLFEFLRFPSVSTDSTRADAVRDCAAWLDRKLKQIGLKSEIHQTPGHPVVVARNGERLVGRPTVLIYGHYDVQPEDPIDLWHSDPFEPELRDGIIYARGATDNKGQLLAHVLGVAETIEQEGELPVNLIFLFEGEEEVGSPNLENFLREHATELACDVVAVSDTGMVGPGVPTFTYGLRGISCLEVDIVGPSADLHSGVWGGAVANPASVIARLAASLHDAQGRVAIPGFYDRVTPLEDWERQAWADLPWTDEETLQHTGASALVGEPGFSELERRWARPTAEINGIGSGYQGEGSKTIIPARAHLKISFRLVPEQDPAEILDLAEAHLRAQHHEGVTLSIERGHSGSAYLMDPHCGWGKAAQLALAETFSGTEPALIREGGSIPIVQTFKDVLGADTLLLGLALPDCQIHAPNENFPVENFEAGIRLNRSLLRCLADGFGDAAR